MVHCILLSDNLLKFVSSAIHTLSLLCLYINYHDENLPIEIY